MLSAHAVPLQCPIDQRHFMVLNGRTGIIAGQTVSGGMVRMSPRVLVADDDPSSRYLLESILTSGGYEVSSAADGAEALAAAHQDPPDLIITDILMPNMDGYALCREWRADPTLVDIPLVFYTANYTHADDERFAENLGADRFLLKPMDPDDLLHEVNDLLELTEAGDLPHRPPQPGSENEVLKEYNARLVSKLEQQLTEVQRVNQSLTALVDGTIQAIAKLVEARDPYTAGHQERVADLASAIAAEMGYDEDYQRGIRMAGLLHDIGKIYVPAEILTKPRQLTDAEFNIVKLHSEVAYDVLSPIEFPWPIADYVIQHHERMDGSGYPGGLEGDQIVQGGRILAVADVVEAMSSHRPYKTAVGLEPALDEIEANAGRLYDEDVAAACLRLFRVRSYEIPAASSTPLAV